MDEQDETTIDEVLDICQHPMINNTGGPFTTLPCGKPLPCPEHIIKPEDLDIVEEYTKLVEVIEQVDAGKEDVPAITIFSEETRESLQEELKKIPMQEPKKKMSEREKEIAQQVIDARERGRQLRENPPDKPKGNTLVSQGQ